MTAAGRVLAWSAVYLAGGLALSLALIQLFLSDPRLAAPGGALWFALLQTAILLAVFAALTWAIAGRRLGVTTGDLGLVASRTVRRGFLRGFALGTVIAAAALLLGVPAAGARWAGDGGTPLDWLATLGAVLLVRLPAACVEELIFRGPPMVALARQFGRLPDIVGLATCFVIAHALNPAVTALGIANIVLAGVFLGLAFFQPGALWASTGAHLGWNLTLAGLAAPVSGWTLPMPWLDYAPGGPAWLTGGPFGPEGGLLATLCLLGGCVAAGRPVNQERIA